MILSTTIKSISIALVLAITGYFILTRLGGEGEGSPRKQRHESVFSLSFQTDGAPYSKIEALYYADLAENGEAKVCTHLAKGGSLTIPEGRGVEDNVLWIHELLETISQQSCPCDLVLIDDTSKRLISSALEGGVSIKVFRECLTIPGEWWCLNNEIEGFVFDALEAMSESTFGILYDAGEAKDLSLSLTKDLKTLLRLFTLECRMLEGEEESVGCAMELAMPPQIFESMNPTTKKLLFEAQQFAREFKAHLHFALPLTWVKGRGGGSEEDEEPAAFFNEEIAVEEEDEEAATFIKVESVYEEDGTPVVFPHLKIIGVRSPTTESER